MKRIKVLLIVLGAAILIFILRAFVCSFRNDNDDDIQISKIDNLAGILAKTAELPQQYQRGEINLDQLNTMALELQDKYDELTQNTIENANEEWGKMQGNLDEQFESIQKTIDAAKEKCDLPDRAEKLWLSKPQWLALDKEACEQTFVDTEWFDSVTLVYSGTYEAAMQQAKIIAEKAKVPVSTEFKMAQDALSGLSAEEIWAITSGSMLKWIIYTNFGLLATDIDYLITISVDENGKLIIEATNYEQMKK